MLEAMGITKLAKEKAEGLYIKNTDKLFFHL